MQVAIIRTHLYYLYYMYMYAQVCLGPLVCTLPAVLWLYSYCRMTLCSCCVRALRRCCMCPYMLLHTVATWLHNIYSGIYCAYIFLFVLFVLFCCVLSCCYVCVLGTRIWCTHTCLLACVTYAGICCCSRAWHGYSYALDSRSLHLLTRARHLWLRVSH